MDCRRRTPSDDPHNQHCLYAGAIFVYEQSSIQIDGGIYFVNNSAGLDGGKKRLGTHIGYTTYIVYLQRWGVSNVTKLVLYIFGVVSP